MTIELEYSETSLVNCFEIEIVDDSVVEDAELFLVSASSTDPVSFVLNTVTVSIIDNQDRKFSM